MGKNKDKKKEKQKNKPADGKIDPSFTNVDQTEDNSNGSNSETRYSQYSNENSSDVEDLKPLHSSNKRPNFQKNKNKRMNKGKKIDKDDDIVDDDDFDDDSNNEDNKITTKSCQRSSQNGKAKKIVLDPIYQVPPCYAKFFIDNDNDNKQKKEFKLLIKIRKVRTKYSTKLIWYDKNAFTNGELSDLRKHIQVSFSSSCSKASKDKCLTFSGRKGKELKQYLIDKYQSRFQPENIKIEDVKRVIPSQFEVQIYLSDDHDDIAEIEFKYKKWNNQFFREFIDDFKEDMVNEYSLQIADDDIDHNMKYTIAFKGDNFREIFTKYLTEECKMSMMQIKVESSLLLSRKYSKINTYKEMKNRFKNFNTSKYFEEMSSTIQDTYIFEKSKLKSYVINTDLYFNYVFTDDDGNNYYIIKLNILNNFSIDHLSTTRGISEGNRVVVFHKKEKATVIGTISKMNNGLITVIFKLKPNQIPPGCKELPKDQSQDPNDYIVANFDEASDDRKYLYEDDEFNSFDDDDDDDEDDGNKLYTNDKRQKGEYQIRFQPNNAVYHRSAMSLLILDDIESGIKDIITCEPEMYNESMNKVSNDQIKENEPIKIGNSMFTPTLSQKECINFILQSQVSLIQGPPGCGKTTSIGFFVYHLIKRNQNDRKRILLCAYSNQAVENIVKVVAPIVQNLGKKIVWIPNSIMNFETEYDFNHATDAEKNLSYYKILTENKNGCAEFQKLQKKKWIFDREMLEYEMATNKDNFSFSNDFQFFSERDRDKMRKLQMEIESKLVSESDVVCCTLLQSAKPSIVNYKFEYIFIDEATQVDQITSLIPLIHQPSRLILLGDHQQLDPFIDEKLKRKHPFSTQSLYLYLISKQVKSVMLREQFRMNPLIAEFPNREFYDNKIINADGMAEKTAIGLKGIRTPILFVDVKNGIEEKVYGSSYKNVREAEIVKTLLMNFKNNMINGSEVGVITPYSGQKDLIRKKASVLFYENVRISSVDSFQGSERDFIILSLTRSNQRGELGFVSNKNRINVSITRARKGLIIVGNYDTLVKSRNNSEKNQFMFDLCEFYKENNAVVDSSKIVKVTRQVTPCNIIYNKKIVDNEFDDDEDDDNAKHK